MGARGRTVDVRLGVVFHYSRTFVVKIAVIVTVSLFSVEALRAKDVTPSAATACKQELA